MSHDGILREMGWFGLEMSQLWGVGTRQGPSCPFEEVIEKMEPSFSLQGVMGGTMASAEARESQAGHRKMLFHWEDSPAVGHVPQRGCAASILGGLQDPTWRDLVCPQS